MASVEAYAIKKMECIVKKALLVSFQDEEAEGYQVDVATLRQLEVEFNQCKYSISPILLVEPLPLLAMMTRMTKMIHQSRKRKGLLQRPQRQIMC